MGTYLRVLSESYLMNTKMTGFRGFKKSLHPCALDESSLSIGRDIYVILHLISRHKNKLKFNWKLIKSRHYFCSKFEICMHLLASI